MKEEVWQDIKGFEGYYQVSNMGRAKSLERTVENGRGYYKTVPEKILKVYDNGRGYLFVQLCKDGKVKNCFVHRLVADAFCENPSGYKEINHINEDKSDNRAENLEWCDRAYNIKYGTRNQRMAEKRGKAVISINKISGLILEFPSISEASKQTGISLGGICECCTGKRKSVKGYVWFYAE